MQPIEPITQLVSRLWSHLESHRRRQFLGLLILMILASFAEILSIGAVLPFLGALMQPERVFVHPAAQPVIRILGLASPNQLVLPLTIIFVLASLAAGGMRFFLLWANTRFSFAVGSELSIKAYRSTLYQPYSLHISRNSSEVLNGIWVKLSEVTFYVLLASMTLISSSAMAITITLALFFIIPSIALAIFGGFGFIYVLIIMLARNRLKNYSQTVAYESTKAIKSIQEGMHGIRDVLIDGSQESFCNIFQNTSNILRRAQGSSQLISQSPRYAVDVLAMTLVAVLAYVLSVQPGGISIAVPMLAALALSLQRLLPFLQQVYGAVSTIYGAQTSLQDSLMFLDQPLPDYAGKPAAKPLPFQLQIRLKEISFRYNMQTPWVLEKINLTIAKGARVGFIGATGCGKSTLLDIIMGLLQPTEGMLEIDNQPIDLTNQRSWQAHIAHVPQAVFLADCSIEENIAFGVPKYNIDQERVRSAARQAQIADVIETWPLKYQTIVGERGVQLSGGQRQRIGIARALYKQADVIIFDEATNALDGETEHAVMQAIDSLNENITVLIIAHRLNTLKNCTDIIELDKGGAFRREAPCAQA